MHEIRRRAARRRTTSRSSAQSEPRCRPQWRDRTGRRYRCPLTIDGSIAFWNASPHMNPVARTTMSARITRDRQAALGARHRPPERNATGAHDQCDGDDPRLAPAHAIGDRAGEWREHGDADADQCVREAPELLAAHRVADHRVGEVRREDVGVDEGQIGRARELEECPGKLPAPVRNGLARRGPIGNAGSRPRSGGWRRRPDGDSGYAGCARN